MAIKEGFAKHTNWANIAMELSVRRPLGTPVFHVDGKSITSDGEAIEAMANHIGNYIL